MGEERAATPVVEERAPAPRWSRSERQPPGGRGASVSERHETGPAPTCGGLVARAWRPSHLDQRRQTPVVDEVAATPGGRGASAGERHESEARTQGAVVSRLGPGGPRTSTNDGTPSVVEERALASVTRPGPAPTGGGLEARAWRPSHLDQRRPPWSTRRPRPRWSTRRPQPPVVEERARASVTRPGVSPVSRGWVQGRRWKVTLLSAWVVIAYAGSWARAWWCGHNRRPSSMSVFPPWE